MDANDRILGAIGELAGKLDSLIEYRKDHEMRIRELELVRQQALGGWKIVLVLSGICSTIGAAVGAVITWVFHAMKH